MWFWNSSCYKQGPGGSIDLQLCDIPRQASSPAKFSQGPRLVLRRGKSFVMFQGAYDDDVQDLARITSLLEIVIRGQTAQLCRVRFYHRICSSRNKSHRRPELELNTQCPVFAIDPRRAERAWTGEWYDMSHITAEVFVVPRTILLQDGTGTDATSTHTKTKGGRQKRTHTPRQKSLCSKGKQQEGHVLVNIFAACMFDHPCMYTQLRGCETLKMRLSPS